MIKIYSSNLQRRLTEAEFNNATVQLPADMQEKAKRYKKWQDAQAYIIGRLLLKKGLSDMNVSKYLDSISFTDHGKPYIAYGPEFSITHTDGLIICAVAGDSKIGIDAEKIKPYPLDIFKNLFTSEEWDSIIFSGNRPFTFLKYYTIKEAIIKADGRGLGVPLSNIRVNGSKVMCENTTWYVNEVYFDDDHISYFASDVNNMDLDLISTDINELLGDIK